tara:strand:- start:146 stop:631 length:486 start_codon:yes stop_codon:yes gene_type:complete
MATINQWRPAWRPGELSEQAQLAFRKLFDFVYSQSQASAPSAQFVRGTDSVEVSTTAGGTGLSVLTLSRPGTWLLSASLSLNIVGDPSQIFTLYLNVNNLKQPYGSQVSSATDGIQMLTQTWQITVTSTATCQLQVVKDGGGGTSFIDGTHSTFSATWQGS